MALIPKPSLVKPKKDTENKTIEKPKAAQAPKFIMSGNYNDMQERVQNESATTLSLYPEYIFKDGINFLMILPGMESTDGYPVVTKMTHGISGGCARTAKADRFEMCPKCDHWYKNRSTKEERDNGKKRPADSISPSTKGVAQIIDFTWALESEKVRDGDRTTYKPISTEIDMDVFKTYRGCFLDLKTFDSTKDKCKTCPASKACFQGPQFMLLSGERTKELMLHLGRIATKKTATINGKEIALRGNVSLGWWSLNPLSAGSEEDIKRAKAIASLVSFPLIITKTVDPKLDKMKGTRYDVSFARESLLLPAGIQLRAMTRARDMGEYRASISIKQAEAELKLFLSQVSSDSKPKCFGNDDIHDSDECLGKDGCAAYNECCVKHANKNEKGSGKPSSKQNQRVPVISDDDDDDAEIASMMKFLESK